MINIEVIKELVETLVPEIVIMREFDNPRNEWVGHLTMKSLDRILQVETAVPVEIELPCYDVRDCLVYEDGQLIGEITLSYRQIYKLTSLGYGIKSLESKG